MKKLGIVILIIGLVVALTGGINYVTKEKIVDIGELEITTEKSHSLDWLPYLGVGLMAVGLGVILLGKEKS